MNPKKSKKSKKRQTQKQYNVKTGYLIRNVLVLAMFILIIYLLYSINPGYKWLVKGPILQNLRIVWSYPHLELDKKYQAKLGFDYEYVNLIKQNTPENAVLLMPGKEIFKNSNFNQDGAWGVKSKTWCTYFLYPRILISEDDKNILQMKDKITHIMIINYWGYDKVPFVTDEKHQYAILRVDPES